MEKNAGDSLKTQKAERRHDVDWLRVIALLLLIVYHAAVGFQPWAYSIGFIQHPESLEWLWLPLTVLNVWRIPILFMISGMGLRFAMERRNGKQLMQDRLLRIGLPLVFGTFTLNALLPYFALPYYGLAPALRPNDAHLWFLSNILVYFFIFSILLWRLKNNPDNRLFRLLRRLLRFRLGLYAFALPYMLAPLALGATAESFISYRYTLHGWALGGLCLLTGFIFISLGEAFWQALKRVRRVALCLAVALYALRFALAFDTHVALVALESFSWIIALLAYAARYLNRDSKLLRYLSGALYPAYILHLPLQFALSATLFRQPLRAELAFPLLLGGVLLCSFALYEIIRRLKPLRPFFGMKLASSKRKNATLPEAESA